jgi:hypothetical protein
MPRSRSQQVAQPSERFLSPPRPIVTNEQETLASPAGVFSLVDLLAVAYLISTSTSRRTATVEAATGPGP